MAPVSHPTRRCWKAVRATIFAVLAGQLALVGHLIGGGHVPNPAALITITGLIGGIAGGLAGRQRTFTFLLTAMTICQVTFHLAFMVSAHAEHEMMWMTTGMVVFHGFAAVITAALLAHGEQALFRLAAAARRIVTRLTQTPPVRLPPGWVAFLRAQGSHQTASAATSQSSRRGPPLPC